jgi:hypothetical protein
MCSAAPKQHDSILDHSARRAPQSSFECPGPVCTLKMRTVRKVTTQVDRRRALALLYVSRVRTSQCVDLLNHAPDALLRWPVAQARPSRAQAYEPEVPVKMLILCAREKTSSASRYFMSSASEEIAGVDADIARDHWQILEVTAKDNEFTIWLDDQVVLTVFDDGKLGAGQFGIWTERDDVTRFNQLEISPLPTSYEPFELHGRSGGEAAQPRGSRTASSRAFFRPQ